jgi:hypothetical protein
MTLSLATITRSAVIASCGSKGAAAKLVAIAST